MPELRKDPVVSRWVIIATERARRPGNVIDSEDHTKPGSGECSFCGNTEKAIHTIRKSGWSRSWKVKVIPSNSPYLDRSTKLERKDHGLYRVMTGYGAHEVVIETPDHVANMADLSGEDIRLVLQTYVERMNVLAQNTAFRYISTFKNYGRLAGSKVLGHSNSQIVATPVIPVRVRDKLSGALKYYSYHGRCSYCDIVKQESEEQVRVVHESEHFLAVIPFAARFLFEMLIIPKRHGCDFTEGIAGTEEDLAQFLKTILQKMKVGLEDPAYNIIVQTAPVARQEESQSKWGTIEEDYHWHIEIIPRITRIAGFEKGSGFYICPIPPEVMAQYLKEVEIEKNKSHHVTKSPCHR